MNRDEAIKVIREYYPSSGRDLNEALETVVPELKESEDERIRKVLIQFFSKGAEYDSSTNGIKDRNIIAWLEKQGSQNLANSAKTCKDEQKPAWTEEDKERYISCLQRLSTGNPAQPETINSKWFKERISPLIFGSLNGEQNSAWSDEDEERLRRCISATFDHGYLKECDWLKSFKDKIQSHWKPTTEQLIYLKAAFEKYDFCDSERGALESLYNDIKKL